MSVRFLSEVAAPETSDRLDPAQLFEDAKWLLQRNDPTELVADLLGRIRETDDRENAIRSGYEASYRSLDQRASEAEDERNCYRERLRVIRHATRDLRLGRA